MQSSRCKEDRNNDLQCGLKEILEENGCGRKGHEGRSARTTEQYIGKEQHDTSVIVMLVILYFFRIRLENNIFRPLDISN